MICRMLLWMLVLTLAGCGSLGRNVFFGDQIQARPVPDVQHVYLDRVGHVYPGDSVVIDDTAWRRTGGLTLLDYFSAKHAKCEVTAEAAWTRELCSLPAATGLSRTQAWTGIQDVWFKNAADELAAAAASRGGPVVIFIHGFRVENANKVYRELRATVERQLGASARPVYLMVHWDGLTSPAAFGVWGKAQWNGFLAGLSLRRVLAELPAHVPVRVITHSSGAFVLSATLGDPRATFEPHAIAHPEFAEFADHAAGTARFPLPRSSDFRAAMIVPATTPLAFSGGKAKETNTVSYAGMHVPAKLIVGVNAKDFGVSKGPVPGAASWFGSTALGESVEGFCQLKKALAARPAGRAIPPPALIDFEGSQPRVPEMIWWDSHDWSDYLKRDKLAPMLGLLFAADRSAAGEHASCKD